jgi:hypothetical protein
MIAKTVSFFIRRRIFLKGFNLIEAAITLAVVGLIIGGVWVASASVNENLGL